VILKLVLLIVITVLDGFTEREPVVLALIVLTSFDFYLYVLTIYPLIYSVDGPHYLIQVRSMLEEGWLKHGDQPPRDYTKKAEHKTSSHSDCYFLLNCKTQNL